MTDVKERKKGDLWHRGHIFQQLLFSQYSQQRIAMFAVKSKTQNICVYAIIMSLNVQLKLRSYYGDLGTVS